MTTTPIRTSVESLDSAAQVLAGVRETTAELKALEIRKLHLSIAWAIMHPAETVDDAAYVPGTEDTVLIAGPGAPLVAEFCIPELALALGLSPDGGRHYLGDSLELRYRLPRLWALATTGRVPVWKAHRIARATMTLPPEGAGFVDQQLAAVCGRCTWAQLDRTIAHAQDLYDPDEAEARRRAKLEGRHFTIETDQVTFDGTMRVEGELDLGDALDLEDAIRSVAQQLADLGCSESLDVRRSMAAGQIARHQHTLDLHTRGHRHRLSPRRPRWCGK